MAELTDADKACLLFSCGPNGKTQQEMLFGIGVLLCGLQGEIITSVTTGNLTNDQLRETPLPIEYTGKSVSLGVGGARFTSADQSGGVASITDAPTTGKKIVVTDLIISTAAAMRVDFKEETSGTVKFSVYMAANDTKTIQTNGKLKLDTVDKKLQIQTSAAGNISITPLWYSEA